MIPRANRLRDSTEFRNISRTGIKYRSPSFVISAKKSHSELGRFGFVVPKRVGNAVIRNLTKRRLRSICLEVMKTKPNLDVVIRAEKPILEMDFDQLSADISKAVDSLVVKLK